MPPTGDKAGVSEGAAQTVKPATGQRRPLADACVSAEERQVLRLLDITAADMARPDSLHKSEAYMEGLAERGFVVRLAGPVAIYQLTDLGRREAGKTWWQ